MTFDPAQRTVAQAGSQQSGERNQVSSEKPGFSSANPIYLAKSQY
jgi:hypothetical protein